MEPDIHHDPARQAFVAKVGDATALCAYRRQGDTLVLHHTEVPAALRAGGFAGIANEWWHFDHGDRERVRRELPRIL